MAVELNLGKVKKTDAELESDVQKIVGEMGGAGGEFDILWKNPNAIVQTTSFVAQTVAIENMLSYRFYEIIAKVNDVAWFKAVSSGKVPIDAGAVLGFYYINSFYTRLSSPPAESGIYIQACNKSLTNTISNTTENRYLIPYMILGYK
jgi:hypothetical protein